MDEDSMNVADDIANNDANETEKSIFNDTSSNNNAEAENTENLEDIVDNNIDNIANDIDNVENERVDEDDSTPALESKSSENNNQVQRLTRLPLARVKNIMKFDDEVHAASQEAAFLITKATELFIEDFMKEVYQCTLASKKKTVSKRDVDTAIFSHDYFIFLDGALD